MNEWLLEVEVQSYLEIWIFFNLKNLQDDIFAKKNIVEINFVQKIAIIWILFHFFVDPFREL